MTFGPSPLQAGLSQGLGTQYGQSDDELQFSMAFEQVGSDATKDVPKPWKSAATDAKASMNNSKEDYEMWAGRREATKKILEKEANWAYPS
jgi:hypothetical protein